MTVIDNHRRQSVYDGTTASSSLSDNLQRALTDLIELHLTGKQAHWNIVGTNFRDLHLQLDELVEFARGASDDVAERMRALNAVPDGRSDTVASNTTLPQFPAGEISTASAVELVTARTYAAAETLRSVREPVELEDPTTADLLDQFIIELEKQAWLIKSETRLPRAL
ncbi:DNA starvation/stationary phase protection protein [Mycobacterium sp.]|uniref:Dps family protein n=1 Tax=Mycobacterium sp. TaxID=1785 RepID=UPI0025CCB484|nr:DNA starvation/stationary phase protection protein [Mycobacterium sp.]